MSVVALLYHLDRDQSNCYPSAHLDVPDISELFDRLPAGKSLSLIRRLSQSSDSQLRRFQDISSVSIRF